MLETNKIKVAIKPILRRIGFGTLEEIGFSKDDLIQVGKPVILSWHELEWLDSNSREIAVLGDSNTEYCARYLKERGVGDFNKDNLPAFYELGIMRFFGKESFHPAVFYDLKR